MSGFRSTRSLRSLRRLCGNGLLGNNLCFRGNNLSSCGKSAFGGHLLCKGHKLFLCAKRRKGIDLFRGIHAVDGRLAIDTEMEHCFLSKVSLNAHKGNLAQLGGFFLSGHHVVAMDTPISLEEHDSGTMQAAQDVKDCLVRLDVSDLVRLGLVVVRGLVGSEGNFAMRALEVIDFKRVMFALLL
jgi:hypothetical protein